MDRGAWGLQSMGTQSQTQLSTHAHAHEQIYASSLEPYMLPKYLSNTAYQN